MNILKNKRANVLAGVMVALILFMVGMIVVNFIKPEVTQARADATCTAPATDGTKLLCLGIDIVVPYFIVLVFSIAGGILTDKFLI